MNMYAFGFPETAILIGLLFVCIFLLFLLQKRIRKHKTENAVKSSKKGAISSLIAGGAVIILAVFFHLQMQADVLNTSEFLRPISEMTAAPVFVITFGGGIIGLTLIIAGSMLYRD
jgi:ABC-type Fe3+ transport system permease subunit